MRNLCCILHHTVSLSFVDRETKWDGCVCVNEVVCVCYLSKVNGKIRSTMTTDERYKYTIKKVCFLFVLIINWQVDYANIFAEYATKFQNSPVPLCKSTDKLVNKFEKNGTVAHTRWSGLPHSVCTGENIETSLHIRQKSNSVSRKSSSRKSISNI